MTDGVGTGAADLRQLLNEGIDASRALIELLGQEQPVLKSGPAEQIDGLLDQKRNLLERLEQVQRQMARSLTPGRMKSSGPDKVLNEFRHNLELCRKLNMQSDLIVRYRIDHTRRALDILSGQGGGDHLYLGNGKQPARRDGRLLMRI